MSSSRGFTVSPGVSIAAMLTRGGRARRLFHSRALAKRDPLGVEQASRLFEEESGAMLMAAEAAAEAARIYSDQGKTGRAAGATERARSLAAQCPGARTPALSNFEVPLPLTRREREIACLAAKGLSSRDIAEQLVISVRTIDNHLLRVYSKLNVSGREELVEVLGTSFASENE